ncbi:MAG: LysM peptidoglycan-binding domain-containing protein [Actinomycetia bacterium]|nr:LysM peptidoglycan-binding domain-containing protein [Actinomycetes bacterium]
MTTTAQRMRGLAALVALAIAIAGVPWALWTYAGGAPWAALGEPSGWLTTELDNSAIVAILTALLWLAWAYFVVCVAIEVVRARQNRPAPSGGIGAQPLARRLVASVLLLVGTATVVAPTATAAAGGGANPSNVGAVHASAQVALERVSEASNLPPGSVSRVAGDGASARQAAVAGNVATAPNAKLGLSYYVQPPQGRSHDCLWDIAERTLGDGMRWTEIYELNKNRVQADGNRMADPDLIYPGWMMVLPDDAKGPNVVGVSNELQQSSGKSGGTAQGSGDAVDRTTSTDGASQDGTASAVSSSSNENEDHSTMYAQLGLGGGLIAAGLLWGLRRRRGWNGGDPPGRGRPFEEEYGLQLRADRPAAMFADRAMRSLGKKRDARPSVARLGADQMSVRFDMPPGPPASGWVAGADAYEWTVREDALPHDEHDAESAAPQLVCIGTDGSEQVLVNLAAAGGIVAVSGDTRVASEMARSIVVDLATHAWADVIEVLAVGFHEDLLPLGGGRLRQFEFLDDAIAHVRGSVQHRLSERVIVSAVEPSRTQAATLTGFATDRDKPIGVFCCGEIERAGLRLSVNADGVVVPSGWGLALSAQRLAAASIPPLVALYGQDVVPADAGTQGAVPGYDPRVADPTAPVVADVRLLGPVSVEASGEIDDERRAQATEIVACLALHPEGIHQRVLEGMVWPRGASDDVVTAAMDHVASWLRSKDGRDAVSLTDGRWHLDLSHVRVDWHIVASAAAGGGTDGGFGALRYVEGSPLDSLPAGRYAWVRPEEPRRMREGIVAVAEGASAAAADQGHPDRAVEALRLGLGGVPDAEVLWRRLLRLTAGSDGDVATVADEMFATLGRCGSPRGPEGSTLALVDDLLPNRPRPELTA